MNTLVNLALAAAIYVFGGGHTDLQKNKEDNNQLQKTATYQVKTLNKDTIHQPIKNRTVNNSNETKHQK